MVSQTATFTSEVPWQKNGFAKHRSVFMLLAFGVSPHLFFFFFLQVKKSNSFGTSFAVEAVFSNSEVPAECFICIIRSWGSQAKRGGGVSCHCAM